MSRQRPKRRNGLAWGLYLLDFRCNPEGEPVDELHLPRWLPNRMAEKLADRLAQAWAEDARREGYRVFVRDGRL